MKKNSIKTTAVLALLIIAIVFAGCPNDTGDKEPHYAVIIDLGNIVTDGDADTEGSYTVTDNVITVSAANAGADDNVLIKGDGSAGYSIEIAAAKNVYIDNNTTIVGAANVPALRVKADDVTLHGRGSGITITGGNGTSGIEVSGTAIMAEGNLTIAGTIGTVQGGDSPLYQSPRGYGIEVGGNLIIAGKTGDIKSGFHAQGSNDYDSGQDGRLGFRWLGYSSRHGCNAGRSGAG